MGCSNKNPHFLSDIWWRNSLTHGLTQMHWILSCFFPFCLISPIYFSLVQAILSRIIRMQWMQNRGCHHSSNLMAGEGWRSIRKHSFDVISFLFTIQSPRKDGRTFCHFLSLPLEKKWAPACTFRSLPTKMPCSVSSPKCHTSKDLSETIRTEMWWVHLNFWLSVKRYLKLFWKNYHCLNGIAL